MLAPLRAASLHPRVLCCSVPRGRRGRRRRAKHTIRSWFGGARAVAAEHSVTGRRDTAVFSRLCSTF
eukprot:COSAG02_NODE_3787_length_6232_cov_22.002120_6_plen_67_part_00